MTPQTEFTVLNAYVLKDTAAAFTDAIVRLAVRVEREGHPGVLAYRFFVDEAGSTARAVVDYRDAAAWIGHHEIAMDWPEMKALHSVTRLEEITFLGPFAPEIQTWLGNSTLTARIRHGNRFAAGFRRGPPR